MNSLRAVIKWCYARWGQVFCFAVATLLTIGEVTDTFAGPDWRMILLSIAWLYAGLTLRWQSIIRK